MTEILQGNADDAVRAAALAMAHEDMCRARGALACAAGNLRAAGLPGQADAVDIAWDIALRVDKEVW